jgi:hypothetical protein
LMTALLIDTAMATRQQLISAFFHEGGRPGPSYRAHPRLYLRCRAGAWRMSRLLRVQPLGEVN